MKPRIFIAMHYMEIGGAESSLIGLLEALAPERVEVDLFVYSHRGLYMSVIPSWVNVLPEVGAYASLECPMSVALKKKQFGMVLGRLLAKWRYKRYQKTLTADEREKDISVFPLITDSCMPFLPSLHHLGEYDLAISYLQPHDIVRKNVKAKKYLAWIHTDYSTVHFNKEHELKTWGEYDYINSISPECTKSFTFAFPELKDKIIEIENILPKSIILAKAEDRLAVLSVTSFCESEQARASDYRLANTLTLCSVGRIGYAKNYDNIPRMAAALKVLLVEEDKNNKNPSADGETSSMQSDSACLSESVTSTSSVHRLSTTNQNHIAATCCSSPSSEAKYQKYHFKNSYKDFKWYIVGPGDHESIDRLSKELGVKENVVFLGPSDNPYPYIKNCDIYVHPSRYEGKSIVVREAQVLCKPVIITNYPTAHSQINDGIDGIICEQTNEGVAKAIFKLSNDKKKQEQIIEYLKTHDLSGQSEVENIYNLL